VEEQILGNCRQVVWEVASATVRNEEVERLLVSGCDCKMAIFSATEFLNLCQAINSGIMLKNKS
jgi:hypothetical protein